jgi:hypothetical protein
MSRITKLFAIGLLLASTCFAATSNASLKGVYAFQLASAHYDSWSASLSCPNNQTVTFGGSTISNQSVQGTFTLDGKGNITAGTYFQYGQFDQSESNATVVPSCTQGQGNGGSPVYDPPEAGTLTGTYSIGPDGTGTLTVIPSTNTNGNVPAFNVTLAGAAAVKNTIFLVEVDTAGSSNPNKMEVSGMAVPQ